jgi:hypothetical protein
MIFTPGKVFDSLDEVVITRWFAFIRDPMAKCERFHCHAFPITIDLLIYQFSLGIVSEVYKSMEDRAICLSVLSGLYECLAVCENTAEADRTLRDGDGILRDEDRIPQGLHKQVYQSQLPQIIDLYRGLADYLECCVVVIHQAARLLLQRQEGVIRRGPGISLIRRSFAEALKASWTDGRRMNICLLPPVDYFITKVKAIAEFASKMTEGIIPEPAKTRPKPGTLEFAINLCVQAAHKRCPDSRSFLDYLRATREHIDKTLGAPAFQAAQTKGIPAETMKEALSVDVGVARDLLRRSYESLVKVWRAKDAARPGEEVSFKVEIELVTFPVPMLTIGEEFRIPPRDKIDSDFL